MLRQFLLLLAICLMTASAIGEPVVWEAHTKRLELDGQARFLVEPADQRLSIEQVRALPEGEWTPNPGWNINFGYGDEVYWFRIRIENAASEAIPALLEIGYPVLDHVGFHAVREGQVVKSLQLGDKRPFYDRPIYHRNFIVPVNLSPEAPLELYLRVDTTSSMQVPLTLWNQEAFYAVEQSRNIVEGLYYGIVFVMVLYHLFVFVALGERSFLYYVGYILAMPLFLASLHGFTFQYLWPEAVWWNDQAIIFFLNLVVVFGGLFTLRFINVRPDNHPTFHRATRLVVSLSMLGAMATLFIPYQVLIVPTIGLAAVGCIGMLVLSVVRLIKGEPAARYYTLAWFFMLFGGLVLALNKFTVLPLNLFTENATQIGSALGVILLSLALADRLNQEKQKAFAAQQSLLAEERKAREAQAHTLKVQQEANALLERRVEERTRDLKELNERLRQLSSTDALTGLKNRGYFDKAFRQASVRAYRYEQPLSLLVVDIDHFKEFNDNYGHLVGDDCLQMVAQGIQSFVTRPQDLAARYGGEEFVVLLPETPEDGAVRVAEKIRQKIQETDFEVAGKAVHLTVSIGVCTLTPALADATKLLFRHADQALYAAKARGRNRVVAYRPCFPHRQVLG